MNSHNVIDDRALPAHGGTTLNELTLLSSCCVDKKVLELGSEVGRSSVVIAEVAQHLTCVDAWNDSYSHIKDQGQKEIYLVGLDQKRLGSSIFEVFKSNCNKYIANGKLCFFRETTEDAVNNFQDNSFDVIFIDADHSYEGVKKDIQNYLPKLKPSGFLICHDYNSPSWMGVKQACNEYAALKKIQPINAVGVLGVFLKL